MRVLSILASGALGWAGATFYERKKLNFFSDVQAATLMPAVPNNVVTSRTAEIMKYGFPGTDSIRMFDNYVLSYDKRHRTANWVFEHLTADRIKANEGVDRSECEFHEDLKFHKFFRATNMDYRGSGYDRGHLAAAGNHRLSLEHCQNTFLLSNMSPQVGRGFNRDSWNNLERYVRNLTKTNLNVYVCTGPLYLPKRESDGKMFVKYEVIGQNHVSVPTHFFKVIVTERIPGELHLESFVMPNVAIDNSVPLKTFLMPLESVERAAGLIFFDKLPNQAFKSVNGQTGMVLSH